MYRDEAFRVLGISPTENTKEIKKAYAALVKKYHPEEHPVEWKKIHDAYEIAMGQSGDFFAESLMQENVWPEESEISKEAAAREERPEDLFDNLDELAAMAKRQNQEEEAKLLSEAISELLILQDKRKMSLKDWKDIFEKEAFQKIVRQDKFIMEFGRILENKAIGENIYRYLLEQIEMIRQQDRNMQFKRKKIGIADSISFAEGNIRAAYKRAKEKNSAAAMKWSIPVIGFLIVCSLLSKSADNKSVFEEMKKQKQEFPVILEPEEKESRIEVFEGIYIEDFIHNSGEPGDFYFRELLQEEVGEIEGITLTDENFFAFEILADSEYNAPILYCDMKALGFGDEFDIYYYENGKYEEVTQWDIENPDTAGKGRNWYELYDCCTFPIDIPLKNSEVRHPIVIVGNR